jgi:hypothetical protein
MRKSKSKNKHKKREISEAQKAFIKGCQESSLTVGNYGKENKVSPASLYRWAELAGVSLKPGKRTKNKTNQNQSTPPKTESSHGSKTPKGGEIRTETQKMPEFEFTYTFKEFSNFIKKVIAGAFSKK